MSTESTGSTKSTAQRCSSAGPRGMSPRAAGRAPRPVPRADLRGGARSPHRDALAWSPSATGSRRAGRSWSAATTSASLPTARRRQGAARRAPAGGGPAQRLPQRHAHAHGPLLYANESISIGSLPPAKGLAPRTWGPWRVPNTWPSPPSASSRRSPTPGPGALPEHRLRAGPGRGRHNRASRTSAARPACTARPMTPSSATSRRHRSFGEPPVHLERGEASHRHGGERGLPVPGERAALSGQRRLLARDARRAPPRFGRASSCCPSAARPATSLRTSKWAGRPRSGCSNSPGGPSGRTSPCDRDAVGAVLPFVEKDLDWSPAFAHRVETLDLPVRPLAEKDVSEALAEPARPARATRRYARIWSPTRRR